MEITKKTRVGSYGLIIKDNKIALIRKARGGYKGLLDLPGGGVEHGEKPEETLIREIKEETGCNVYKYKLLGVQSTVIKWHDDKFNEDLHQIGILYEVELKDYSLKKDGDGHDSEGCDFYEIDNLNKDEVTPFVRDGLKILEYDLSKENVK